MKHRIGLLVLLLPACGGSPLHEPCTAEARAKISAAYIADISAQCPEGQPLESCAAYPNIKAKRDAAADRWIQCYKP